MKLNVRTYQKIQTKSILKKNNFLFLTIGANQSSTNWVTLEQNLHQLNLSYAKMYNNLTIKIFQDSIAKKLKNSISSTFFFLMNKNTNNIIKSNLLTKLYASKFDVMALKLNRKFHTAPQLQKLNSFHYKENVAVLYQFLFTTIKSPLRFRF